MEDHLTDSLLCQWYPVHHPLCLGFLHRGERFLQLRVDSLLFRLFSHHESAVALIRVEVEKETGKSQDLPTKLTFTGNTSDASWPSRGTAPAPSASSSSPHPWRPPWCAKDFQPLKTILVLAQSSYKRIGFNVWQEIYTRTLNQFFYSCNAWSRGFHLFSFLLALVFQVLFGFLQHVVGLWQLPEERSNEPTVW